MKLSVIKTYVIAASLIYLAIASLGLALAVGGQVGNNIWLSLWSNEVDTLGVNASTISITTRIGTYGGLALVQGKIFFFCLIIENPVYKHIVIRVVVEARTSETKTETETWVAETKTETEVI